MSPRLAPPVVSSGTTGTTAPERLHALLSALSHAAFYSRGPLSYLALRTMLGRLMPGRAELAQWAAQGLIETPEGRVPGSVRYQLSPLGAQLLRGGIARGADETEH